MVMKAMLIGLLVIGAVAMLETDANARHCDGYACRYFTLPEDLEKVVAEVKKYEGSEVWFVGYTDWAASSKDYGRPADVQEILIQRGLRPDIFRELILEGRPPLTLARKGQRVLVAWPCSGDDCPDPHHQNQRRGSPAL
jgi:hypothetical protein